MFINRKSFTRKPSSIHGRRIECGSISIPRQNFSNLDRRDSVSWNWKKGRQKEIVDGRVALGHAISSLKECPARLSEACYVAILSKGRATFSNWTYRTVEETTGIHAQVQAGRDTLDPELTPGHRRSLKYRCKGKKENGTINGGW